MRKFIGEIAGLVWTCLDIDGSGLKCQGKGRTMLHHNSSQKGPKKGVWEFFSGILKGSANLRLPQSYGQHISEVVTTLTSQDPYLVTSPSASHIISTKVFYRKP